MFGGTKTTEKATHSEEEGLDDGNVWGDGWDWWHQIHVCVMCKWKKEEEEEKKEEEERVVLGPENGQQTWKPLFPFHQNIVFHLKKWKLTVINKMTVIYTL